MKHLRYLIFGLFWVFTQGEAQASTIPFQCLSLEDGIERGCAYIGRYNSSCTMGQEAFVAGSCLLEVGEFPVPEIMEATVENLDDALRSRVEVDSPGNAPSFLPALEAFPAVPLSIFRKYDSNRITRSLLYRHYRIFDQPRNQVLLSRWYGQDRTQLVSLYDRVSLQMTFRPEIIELVAKNGFLNQHETGSSNAILATQYRLHLEQAILALRFEPAREPESSSDLQKLKKILPKYVYANPSSTGPSLNPHNQISSVYGSVVAQFRNEVLHRSTLTSADSLLLSQQLLPNQAIMTSRRLFRASELPLATLQNYAEGQVWGPLKIQDVEFFLVGCFSPAEAKTIAARLHRATGRPVYRCNAIPDSEITAPRSHYSLLLPGERLY